MADNLSCPLCYELFTNVVETPCCSQGFCLSCLDSALKATKESCPNCRKPITIFSCVPNKMVQRMVDNMPAECIFPGCTAKITRGIRKEHIEKCPNKPKEIGSPCPLHKLPLSFICEEDKESICSLCNIVGKHRTHKMGIKMEGENSIFLKGIKNIALLSKEADMEANLASFPYILADGVSDINVLEKVINHNVAVPVSNSNNGKEEMRALSPMMREHKIVTTAACLCLMKNVPITAPNMSEMLRLAGIDSLSDNQFLKLLESNQNKVKEWLRVTPEGAKADKFNKLIGEPVDEKSAEKEYEQLKENYHNENFNFQGIQIKALPLCSKLLPNVTNHVYVLLEIRVGKKEEKSEDKRPPFSLSIVLDRSGSMAGSKIEMAKEAIKGVVDKLEPEDELHMIQYDDQSQIVFEKGGIYQKEELKNLISACKADGGTNISGGLQKGFDVVNRSQIPTKKVFLFSDGQAGSGITSKPEMFKFVTGMWEKGVGISAFGIGSDYDELMMKGISESGKGHYFFIDSPKNTGKILDKAFKGLARTVASSVVLKVKGNKGRIVTKVKESSNKETEDVFKGIVLGDMREKDIKQVLLQVEINEVESIDPIEILTFELSYEKLDACVPDSPVTGNVVMTTTSNLDDLSVLNDDALVYLTIHECSELDKKVLKFLEQNLLENAIDTKTEVIDALKSVVSRDKVGFVKVLLMKAKRSLVDLVNLYASRNRVQASAYGGIGSGASAKSYEHIKKEQHKACEDEDEADMGFGLFD